MINLLIAHQIVTLWNLLIIIVCFFIIISLIICLNIFHLLQNVCASWRITSKLFIVSLPRILILSEILSILIYIPLVSLIIVSPCVTKSCTLTNTRWVRRVFLVIRNILPITSLKVYLRVLTITCIIKIFLGILWRIHQHLVSHPLFLMNIRLFIFSKLILKLTFWNRSMSKTWISNKILSQLKFRTTCISKVWINDNLMP